MSSQRRTRGAKGRSSNTGGRKSGKAPWLSRPWRAKHHFETLEERRLLAADFDLLSGNRVDRAIDAAGDVDRFDFAVAAPTRISFDSFTNDSQLNWSLSGPAGVLVDRRDFADSESWNISSAAIELTPGNYEITVAAAGSHTGPYGFRLIDLSSAVTVTPGAQIDAMLDPANETDAYRFDATAGDKFYFDALSSSTQTRRGD